MREQLFRGRFRDRRSGKYKWVVGNSVLKFADQTVIIFDQSFGDQTKKWMVDPQTIGVSVGPTAVNGRPLFEGDIVESATPSYQDGIRRVVEYSDHGFTMRPIGPDLPEHERDVRSNVWIYQFRIVGNIHDYHV